jgi:hypothetical protein
MTRLLTKEFEIKKVIEISLYIEGFNYSSLFHFCMHPSFCIRVRTNVDRIPVGDILYAQCRREKYKGKAFPLQAWTGP